MSYLERAQQIIHPKWSPTSGLLLLLISFLTGGCGQGPDTSAPDRLTGIRAITGDGSITIAWNASIAEDLSHYLVYRGTNSISLSSIGENITTNSKTMTDLTEGTRYYFYVTAVDDAGNESEPSSIVNAFSSSATYETALGWSAFVSGFYGDAITFFDTALGFDQNHADAASGIGWSHAMLGHLNEAVAAFEMANSLGLSTQDANAGLAVVYRDLPDLESAISSAGAVVSNEPAYSFSHRPSIDYRDMHLIMAQCYYRLGEIKFPDAQAQVDILDPDNGLNPGDPVTWIVGGLTYQTYAEALLIKIEELESMIGG